MRESNEQRSNRRRIPPFVLPPLNARRVFESRILAPLLFSTYCAAALHIPTVELVGEFV